MYCICGMCVGEEGEGGGGGKNFKSKCQRHKRSVAGSSARKLGKDWQASSQAS